MSDGSSDYRYLLVDSSTGNPVGEAPLSVSGFNYVKNGAGTLTATLPLDDPNATSNLFALDREVTALRNDHAVWNGPITNLDASRSSGQLQITAREAPWYFTKRTLEEDRTYAVGTDVHDIIADLNTYLQGKVSTAGDGMTPGSNIVADLPRWSLSCPTGTVTAIEYTYFGVGRHTIQEILDEIAADPDAGFEYRMDYSTGSTRQSCHRTWTVGVPSLGTTRTELLTEHVLFDVGRALDWENAATRVHVVGSGYTQTLQDSGAVGAGWLLSERVVGLTDVSSHPVINSRAREERRLAQPPVEAYTASFVPGASLPFGWCDLGDLLSLKVSGPPLLAISDSRRVVQVDVTPPQGGAPELVSLTFNLPLTDLGT